MTLYESLISNINLGKHVANQHFWQILMAKRDKEIIDYFKRFFEHIHFEDIDKVMGYDEQKFSRYRIKDCRLEWTVNKNGIFLDFLYTEDIETCSVGVFAAFVDGEITIIDNPKFNKAYKILDDMFKKCDKATEFTRSVRKYNIKDCQIDLSAI